MWFAPRAITLQIIGPAVQVRREILELTSHDTMGDGGGVTVIVSTTSGCVLGPIVWTMGCHPVPTATNPTGATAVNERGKAAELTGATAAREVLTTLQEGACVDQWYGIWLFGDRRRPAHPL